MGAWVPGTTAIWTSGTKVTGLHRAHAANVRFYQTYASACGQTHVCFAVYPEGSSIAGALGVGDTETARTPPAMASGVVMRQVQAISRLHIVHPTCPKCGATMLLTRVAQDGPDWEQRTFECQACQNETIDVVRGDRP